MDAKPCGLISVVPPLLQDDWSTRLEQIIKNFRPAALILRGPFAQAAMRIVEQAKPLDLAVLFEDKVEDALRASASGVYFSTEGGDVAGARAALGSASVLGIACGFSRHAAMEGAEAGADFVAFDTTDPKNMDEAADLSSWWDEITGVPVALSCGAARPSRSILEAARADFVILEEIERAAESLTFATEFGLQSLA